MVRTLRLLARRGKLALNTSNFGSKTVLLKEIKVVHESNIQWRGRSYAASAPSDIPNSPKERKKVSLDERRAMVEAYVKKYREANAGKFPSASNTMKEVHGSYYVVKKIIEELEYKSKFNLLNSEAAAEKRSQPSKKRKPQTVVEEIRSQATVYAGNEEIVPSTAVSDNLLDGSTVILKEEIKGQKSQDDHAEVQLKIHAVKVDLQKSSTDSGHTQMQEKECQQSPGSDRSVKGTDHSELPQKSSLWGNLKSFADGIISIWRKQ